MGTKSIINYHMILKHLNLHAFSNRIINLVLMCSITTLFSPTAKILYVDILNSITALVTKTTT